MADLVFDPANPYPLIDLSQVAYETQKAHARQVDEWLGFQVESVESAIERLSPSREKIREQWIGLPPQSLQTPYVEFRRMLHEVRNLGVLDKTHARIVDVGAAYGRLGFVTEAHAPRAKFIGIEICQPRVSEGNRIYRAHGLKNSDLIELDVLSVDLPEADVYFCYDFGSPKSIEALLEKFRLQAQKMPIAVVGRGRGIRDHIERKHPWLSQIAPPKLFGNFTIYRTREP